ncbi:MAG: glutamate synthase subunit beta [Leptospiraceae bacterium]|nr:glutamate synthase subunit beta [Leptospiraceae bacterium]
MGKPTGFKEYQRASLKRDPVEKRLKNYKEFEHSFDSDEAKIQGARCMDCGIPFCHGDTGCPVDNLIPEWNDLVYRGHMQEAIENLHSTNNFPEFTGRLCPAPCESACVLGINEPPVSIKAIERTIIDTAFENGWVKPKPPKELTGKTVAVVGSGPAGLAAAQQLARSGHRVTLYEKNDRIGGLLRYGIPDFKMEKWHIDRRMEQMKAEGVIFKTSVNIGVDMPVKDLVDKFDAVVLAGGSEKPRDLPIPGRELNGVYFAMEFLTRNNKNVAGDKVADLISAKGKDVIVIGGGDTGSDCVGTSNRHGAKSVTQLEIFPMPPTERPSSTPWPYWPAILRTSSSHQEGAERKWAVNTKRFIDNGSGAVKAIELVEVKFENGQFIEIEGSAKEIPADLVLLAMGFVHPVHEGLLKQIQDMGAELDSRGNVKAEYGDHANAHRTKIDKVFVAGDMRRGQSLIVWAIAEGRKAANSVNAFLGVTVN